MCRAPTLRGWIVFQNIDKHGVWLARAYVRHHQSGRRQGVESEADNLQLERYHVAGSIVVLWPKG